MLRSLQAKNRESIRSMIGGFASKVKKATDGFERHWPMSGRAESCWPAAGDVV